MTVAQAGKSLVMGANLEEWNRKCFSKFCGHFCLPHNTNDLLSIFFPLDFNFSNSFCVAIFLFHPFSMTKTQRHMTWQHRIKQLILCWARNVSEKFNDESLNHCLTCSRRNFTGLCWRKSRDWSSFSLKCFPSETINFIISRYVLNFFLRRKAKTARKYLALHINLKAQEL